MRWIAVVLLWALVGCSTGPEHQDAPSTPYVLVLGTAQDAGFPQIGARHARARTARRDGLRRMTSSLLLCDPDSGQRWLLDASPDLPRQMELAEGHPASRSMAPGPDGARAPLVDGVFLTHAHMGHYAGLVHFGREAYGARQVPVYGTHRMCSYLAGNGPWELLVRLENIVLRELEPDTPIQLTPSLRVTPFSVPHRAEYTDTVGFRIDGPNRSLLFIPDIDKWDKWDRPIEREVAAVDYALLDASFYADGEIPGRAMAEIPHPFVQETIARFRSLPDSERDKVWLTHINHTNPIVFPTTAASATVRAAGMHVAFDGLILEL